MSHRAVLVDVPNGILVTRNNSTLLRFVAHCKIGTVGRLPAMPGRAVVLRIEPLMASRPFGLRFPVACALRLPCIGVGGV